MRVTSPPFKENPPFEEFEMVTSSKVAVQSTKLINDPFHAQVTESSTLIIFVPVKEQSLNRTMFDARTEIRLPLSECDEHSLQLTFSREMEREEDVESSTLAPSELR